jgi:hypothetical protein
LLGAIGSLGWGMVSMGRGGQYDEEHSEALMFSRIKWHALAIVLLVIAFFVNG